ncbi:MAG: glycosyltransferase family 2 protein [Microcystis aeruginosa K13-05]|jgi:glycosyltransferase involved in cell wall biosynthesis|uniref:glycosyltransferase family 2 protein n=1 Tax=unclassified Microcystis TaxID=2643300 RepID=UPI0022C4AFE0|nr:MULTISPECIES: glycosyltransferase family 2 protein [unclassified Microcystis]MCZ8045190.1 glycosyltransferase family 2 protein [Microcystis sp. LE19-41.2A]MCZ8289226.1 glycosyltransferase family 2 protein [Microcystis sp. LE19-59.1C]NCR80100.1 glycosyltransferase family 2 protein [Microcystis aeruginosa K13-10]NCR84723.1 glycosyltransferase family 2 protein [Microcystis aeruginosa K13-05]
MKKISVVTPCYNEEGNIEEIYLQVKQIFADLEKYDYEHLFIDNASQDKTVDILKGIAIKDSNVKIIVNARNFGAIRSIYYGITQPDADAVVLIFADLQDPPDLIVDFIKKWEEGYHIVKGIKTSSEENFLLYSIRSFYYFLVTQLSDIKPTAHFTGFGLYDKKVVEVLKKIDDPYPYLRGIISEIGFDSAEIEYKQRQRKKGKSSYRNFYRLYDAGMLGITSHSSVPLRMATFLGFALSLLSLLVALGYLIAKLLFWDYFPLGTAPVTVGLFLIASVQLFFIGIIGEYIGLMHMRILKRPLVVERERINFE